MDKIGRNRALCVQEAELEAALKHGKRKLTDLTNQIPVTQKNIDKGQVKRPRVQAKDKTMRVREILQEMENRLHKFDRDVSDIFQRMLHKTQGRRSGRLQEIQEPEYNMRIAKKDYERLQDEESPSKSQVEAIAPQRMAVKKEVEDYDSQLGGPKTYLRGIQVEQTNTQIRSMEATCDVATHESMEEQCDVANFKSTERKCAIAIEESMEKRRYVQILPLLFSDRIQIQQQIASMAATCDVGTDKSKEGQRCVETHKLMEEQDGIANDQPMEERCDLARVESMEKSGVALEESLEEKHDIVTVTRPICDRIQRPQHIRSVQATCDVATNQLTNQSMEEQCDMTTRSGAPIKESIGARRDVAIVPLLTCARIETPERIPSMVAASDVVTDKSKEKQCGIEADKLMERRDVATKQSTNQLMEQCDLKKRCGAAIEELTEVSGDGDVKVVPGVFDPVLINQCIALQVLKVKARRDVATHQSMVEQCGVANDHSTEKQCDVALDQSMEKKCGLPVEQPMEERYDIATVPPSVCDRNLTPQQIRSVQAKCDVATNQSTAKCRMKQRSGAAMEESTGARGDVKVVPGVFDALLTNQYKVQQVLKVKATCDVATNQSTEEQYDVKKTCGAAIEESTGARGDVKIVHGVVSDPFAAALQILSVAARCGVETDKAMVEQCGVAKDHSTKEEQSEVALDQPMEKICGVPVEELKEERCHVVYVPRLACDRIQIPPPGPFNSDVLNWFSEEAYIPISRVKDFIEGESRRKNFECSFTIRKTEDRSHSKGNKIVRYWCSYGPVDLRKEAVPCSDDAQVSAVSRPLAQRKKLGSSSSRGCRCHFATIFLSGRPDVCLIRWLIREHRDKQGGFCHGLLVSISPSR